MRKFLFLFLGIFLLQGHGIGATIPVNVAELSSDPVAKQVRKLFNKQLLQDPSSQDIQSLVLKIYISMLNEKYITLEIEAGEFGGYFVTVLLSQKKMVPLKLWVYQIEKNQYEIREVKKFNLNNADQKQMKQLNTPQYLSYWL